jgi:hypothetical protein
VTLYAQWTVNSYTVTYNANGATGSVANSVTQAYSTTFTLAGVGSLVYPGYSFNGWNTAANGSGAPYAGGAAYTVGASNVTLYAQWTNSASGSTTVSTPGTYTVTITGSTALEYTVSASFACLYTGTAAAYKWCLNGTAVSGATASSWTPTPTYGTWQYGSNLITLLVTDTNGLVYSGSLTVSVSNP